MVYRKFSNGGFFVLERIGMNGRKIHSRIAGPLLPVFWAFLAVSGPFSGAAQAPLLEERHKDAGITCDACHQETPPGKEVPMEVCAGCHGDYAKLAEETGKVEPNPHDSHEGPVPCEKCHHNHRPSENYCASCHNFGFKVP